MALIRSDVFGPGLRSLLCSAKALPGNCTGSRLWSTQLACVVGRDCFLIEACLFLGVLARHKWSMIQRPMPGQSALWRFKHVTHKKNNKTILLKPNKTMLKGLSLAFYESEESAQTLAWPSLKFTTSWNFDSSLYLAAGRLQLEIPFSSQSPSNENTDGYCNQHQMSVVGSCDTFACESPCAQHVCTQLHTGHTANRSYITTADVRKSQEWGWTLPRMSHCSECAEDSLLCVCVCLNLCSKSSAQEFIALVTQDRS